jgi:hypothetical protein
MSNLATLLSSVQGSASVEEAEDVVAVLLMRDPTSLSREGLDLLARFSHRSGVDLTQATPALEAALETHLARKPLNPGVLAALKNVARDLAERQGPASADVRAALSMLGKGTSHTPLGGGHRPSGTVPAGPLARFQADVKKK